eukprot:1898009-Rhodomonas_salina.1
MSVKAYKGSRSAGMPASNHTKRVWPRETIVGTVCYGNGDQAHVPRPIWSGTEYFQDTVTGFVCEQYSLLLWSSTLVGEHHYSLGQGDIQFL